MKAAVFLGIICAALLTGNCRAAIDWTYHPSVQGDDGPTMPYVTALLAGKQVSYVPPVKWSVSGSRVLPPGKRGADGYFEAYSIKAPAPWTPDRIKVLHGTISSCVPRGATAFKIDSEGESSLRFDGQNGYEIVFSYEFYGQKYSESVLVVERGALQIRCHFGSLTSDFGDLHSTFNGSLFTLRGL